MSKYQRILLAADLIPEDDDPVTKRALAIANAKDAELHIVHAVEYVYTYGVPPAPVDIATWQKELEENAQTKLIELGKKLNVDEKHLHLPIGAPKSLILETAENIQADLIVVGRHSRHGLGWLILGSTATGVINHAKCDVLAVHVGE